MTKEITVNPVSLRDIQSVKVNPNAGHNTDIF